MMRLCVVLIWVVVLSAGGRADETAQLIEELAHIAEPGIGYGRWFSASAFLPYPDSTEMQVGTLGAMEHEEAAPLRKLVEQGAAAVPLLIEHLDDARSIRMEAFQTEGVGTWIRFRNHYDANDRTAKQKWTEGLRGWTPDANTSEYRLKIGDLCFVALGQIVNREFHASRYQPTGGTIITSPVRADRLRLELKREWGGLTRETHRERLIADFHSPDSTERQIGAYLRLAFYYPDDIGPAVVRELGKPVFDAQLLDGFATTLQETPDRAGRRQALDTFVRRYGDVYRQAVRRRLFGELAWVEEAERLFEPKDQPQYRVPPRQLLMELFDEPETVKSADIPWSDDNDLRSLARLVGAMTREEDPAIGDAVRKLFLEWPFHPALRPACLRCLANRGHVDLLLQAISEIDEHAGEADDATYTAIEAMATSRDETVRGVLREFLFRTTNDLYFLAALPAASDADRAAVLAHAKSILEQFPAQSQRGQLLLSMIGERYPQDLEAVLRQFMLNQEVERIETTCCVLWSNHPLAKPLLAPFLDDTRLIPGLAGEITVRERAAQAMSHAAKHIQFDSDWSADRKEAAIRRLKAWAAK
jgi:hypothetical protein